MHAYGTSKVGIAVFLFPMMSGSIGASSGASTASSSSAESDIYWATFWKDFTDFYRHGADWVFTNVVLGAGELFEGLGIFWVLRMLGMDLVVVTVGNEVMLGLVALVVFCSLWATHATSE
jgi:hypothetical protein